ncbi:uncharacterized protein CTHT_0031340 [Thermochaetoides thermophila DSM 1495]|uniref:Uncharacterized protein n=1 Tax=Chaetomium thermophilum (strain DSM 1495 / CBS 144.50 / IMI 039719) TaxID=759272 RepID=G0S4K6_CHATD|nr:hypothetical protein CTHT_0031340 [Thermochaetoides thermophila DSM 1495]EGS21281.1 hypothetical protein CTHT_0031340 [Thermochaetoides thermophila DSM 1495]
MPSQEQRKKEKDQKHKAKAPEPATNDQEKKALKAAPPPLVPVEPGDESEDYSEDVSKDEEQRVLDENYQDGTPGSSRRAEADEDERSEEEADEDQAVQTAREEESEEEEEESPALSQPSTPRDDEKPRPKWMDQRLQSAKKADQQMEPACQTRQQVHHEQRQRNISGQRDYNSQLTYRKEQEMMMQPQQQPQVQTY